MNQNHAISFLKPLDKRIKSIPVENWGYFNIPEYEFVLTTPTPPKHWKNILWNQHYNAQPTQASGGICYKRTREGDVTLINWSGARYLYFYNTRTGECFNPGFFPACNTAYEDFACHYGLGYLVTQMSCCGLHVKITQSIDASEPVEYFSVEANAHKPGELKDWKCAFYCELNLKQNDGIFGNNPNFVSHVNSARTQARIQNRSAIDGNYQAQLSCSKGFEEYCFEQEEFIGTYGSPQAPRAIQDGWSHSAPIDMPILAAMTSLESEEGNTGSYICWALSNIELSNIEHQLSQEHMQEHLTAQRSHFEDAYQKPQIFTPDAPLNLYANTWIKHQLNYCAHWNRGWGKGFRDNAQDAWAYCQMDPEHARSMLEDCLPYQYADGSTVRRWAPVVRHRYNDGGVWLVLATHAYLAESGDSAFLDHSAPFFESCESGTTYEHLVRGLDYLWKERGSHGLCLMPFGDWNDRLTGIGKDGRGESVWTTMALAEGLRKLADIAGHYGRQKESTLFKERRTTILEAIQNSAWNGQWFSRAFKDDGSPIGAPVNDEAYIFVLPQAWSILADIATGEQRRAVISAVKEHLETSHGFRLLYPPISAYDPSIGHLSAVPPGRLENGGNYCHGSFFMVYALCESGELDYALEIFHKLLPINPLNPPSHSRQEPFSITNSYASPESGKHSGRSQFPWRTGSAGWALRTVHEGLLGARATLNGLCIRGTIPKAWEQASVTRKYRGHTLNIHWQRGEKQGRELNGIPCGDEPITMDQLTDEENEYHVFL